MVAMPTRVLFLYAVEILDPYQWRWVLKDEHGAFIADQPVALDRTSPKYQALFDLPAYLRHYVAPDKREEDERRLTREFGLWIIEYVLGQGIGQAIVARAKPIAAVRVIVPE